MLNPEKLKPRTGHENGDVSLKRILGGLMPNEELYRDYLESVLRWRATWVQTGVEPPFDKDVLGGFIAKDPKIREKMAKQLRLIHRATQILGVSVGEPIINPKGFAVNGELKPGEIQEQSF